ncbi:MAG: pyridoxamine 5'-phosphate oxidase family protein [Candidatus Hermodarchaeota archaeon]
MSYTQPPHLTENEIENFIKTAKVARICSHNKDDTIHAVPVWYYYENGKLIIGAPKKSRRVANIKRNYNVTVLIDEIGPPTRAVIIYGKASVDEKDMDDAAYSIFRRYMSKEEAMGYWKGLSELTEWVKIIIEPIHLASFDYSKDSRYFEATKKYTT